MIRLLIWLALLAAIGAASAWIADHPGHVTMHWSGYRIDTSVAFLVAVFAIGILVFAYLYLTARALVLLPSNYSRRRQLGCYQQGLTELTFSVAALAAADIKEAEAHSRKAEKLLGKTPLSLLLSAQIARLQGDDAKTHALLEQMLQHKETEYLAARSLADAATKKQLFAKALPLAERARKVNPYDRQPALQLIALHVRLKQWQQALQAALAAHRSGALSRRDKHHFLGMVALLQGQTLLEHSQLDAAYACAKSAVSYLPDFAPALQLMARCLIAQGKNERAIKHLQRSWKRAAHPDLAATLRLAMAREPEARQLKIAESLVSLLPAHLESQLSLAETAIKQKNWGKARLALRAALAIAESPRACKLMAYVEQGEHNDTAAAGRWLEKSAQALPDAAWTCHDCTHRSDTWHSHCPACGAFDTQEWKEAMPLVYAADAA